MVSAVNPYHLSHNQSTHIHEVEQVASSIPLGIFRLSTSFLTISGGLSALFSKSVIYIKSSATKVKTIWDEVFGEKYNTIQGSLYLASGLCGALAGLNTMGAVHLGALLPVVEGIESGTFLVASILGLYHNAQAYMCAASIPENASPDLLEAAQRKKTSAVLGMLGCIGWIVTIVLTFIPPIAAFAFVFGLLATIIGFVKMIYDYFKPSTIPTITV